MSSRRSTTSVPRGCGSGSENIGGSACRSASREQGFTGKHDQNGQVFPVGEDGDYAWSAAFIDYVMRMAGAGHRFPYSPTHADYINAARQTGGGSPTFDLRRAAAKPMRRSAAT